MALIGNTNAQKIWNFCIAKGLTPYGAAGLLGNIDAESALISINLQDSCQGRLGCNDETYVALVDSGVYTKEQFVYDQAGFGLCQWTYWSRKKALYEYAKSTYRSIGDLEMQLEFLFIELQNSFSNVLSTLKSATSVMEASDVVLMEFECPYDAKSLRTKRVSFCQKYYTQFVTKANTGGVSSMGYLTCAKGQATKLSTYFDSTEMDCHGGGCCSTTLINETLVEYLTKIREHFGSTITITSGYRCPTHNARIGGATGSRHSKGDAADIVVSGVAPREVAKYAESIGIMGIGLYETASDGYFVHIDTRTAKSFWYGQNEAYRSTFGGSTLSNTNTGTSATTTVGTTYKTLTYGSAGASVKELQQNLNDLGYSCGTVDGSYGAKTAEAVRKFQRDKKLSIDGIAGPITQAAIKSALAGSFNVGNTVVVVANVLNVRKGAGTNYVVMTTVKKNAAYTLSEIKDGWGKLQELSGWVSLQYCKKQ